MRYGNQFVVFLSKWMVGVCAK